MLAHKLIFILNCGIDLKGTWSGMHFPNLWSVRILVHIGSRSNGYNRDLLVFFIFWAH